MDPDATARQAMRVERVLAVVLLLATVAIEPLRLPGLVLLAVGFGASLVWRRERPASAETLIWGASVLVSLGAVWSGVPLPGAATDGTRCADWLAPFALYRALGAGLVLAAVAVVLRLVGWNPRDIGFRGLTRSSVVVAAASLAGIGVIAVLIGPAMAEPFFGPLPVDVGNLAALAPALVFAVANATLEETVYRGALLRSIQRAQGPAIAMAVQAVAFGLAHGVGNDFAGSPLPIIAATAAGGLAFGIVALRTGSLLLPIALHAALDIPIYYANACLQV
jgi:membrane protease YdiL (CAAX protease family)